MEKETIEIPLSKGKMFLTFIGALAFIAIGIWFLVKPPQISNPIFGNPTLILISGLASILFFGIVAIVILRKFFDKKPGLTISDEGIIDNSSGNSEGIIPWSDITDIEVGQVMSQKFLMIIVKNPQEYINKAKNSLKKNGMKMNYKSYGSPIAISSNTLKMNFQELQDLLNEKFIQNKS